MATPLIITGHPCRYCGGLVSNSIADVMGTPEAGYTCDRCLVKEGESVRLFGQQLTQEATKEITLPGSASNCAMCGNPGTEFRLVHIDGGMGLICTAECEQKWLILNRPMIGPIAQYGLKLK